MDRTEYDVVVVGAGLAGLATAIAVHEQGLSVLVLEKAAQVGGAASWSGGQVWIADNLRQRELGLPDTLEDAACYVRHLNRAADGYLDEEALAQWLRDARDAAQFFEDLGVVRWDVIPDYPDYYQDAPGSRAAGRYLTATCDGSRLGEALSLLSVSPHFPVGTTYDALLSRGLRASAFGSDEGEADQSYADLLTFGTGVVAPFLLGALERGIPIRPDHQVTGLIRSDDGDVVGTVARHGGREVSFLGSVVLATSGYDWDDDLARDYLALEPCDRGSVAPTSLTGDGLRLAQDAGAEVLVFPRNRVPIQLGYRREASPGYAVVREHSLPHTFIVNGDGERFCDDAVYWEVVKSALGRSGDNFPCFMIWDEQHRQRYGLGAASPGSDYPADYGVVQADDLHSLAGRLGVAPAGLAATAAAFNDAITSGRDPAFGRGDNTTWQKFQGDPRHPLHPNLGPVDKAPFYGMRLTMVSTGIGLTGVSTAPDGRALAPGAEPVPGLYVTGAAAAFTSSGVGYNSGFSLSRAISLGWRVAQTLRTEHDTDRRSDA